MWIEWRCRINSIQKTPYYSLICLIVFVGGKLNITKVTIILNGIWTLSLKCYLAKPLHTLKLSKKCMEKSVKMNIYRVDWSWGRSALEVFHISLFIDTRGSKLFINILCFRIQLSNQDRNHETNTPNWLMWLSSCHGY